MITILRKVNIALFIFIALEGVILFHAKSVEATTPFLYYPFYGNSPGLNAGFDHKYPLQSGQPQDGIGVYMRRDGTPSSTPCQVPNINELNCYDGHEGFDFRLAYVPVIAAGSGTVDYTGWQNPNHETSYGLMIRINHGNNHRTVYGHLSAITIQTGSQITYDSNWQSHPQIGTSGTTGNSTGPHLHFGVQYLLNGAWKVKDPYRWTGTFQDPWQQQSGVSSNEYLWVNNPVQPRPPEDGPLVLDDGDPGFTSGCSTGCTWNIITSAGYNNDLRWRYTTNSVVSNGWARWNPAVPVTTRYEVQVFIPRFAEDANRTHAARYEIYRNGTLARTVIVDQHDVQPDSSQPYVGRWISLGRYSFNQGNTSYVRVTDSTYRVCDSSSNCSSYYSEPNNTKKLLVDAFRAFGN